MCYNGDRGPTTPSHANNVRHRLPWVVWPRFESMVLRVSILQSSDAEIKYKGFFSPKNCLHTVAFNCFCSPSLPRRDSPCSASRRFRLGRWKPSSCLMRFPCLDSEENAKPPVVCHAGIGHVGGGSRRGISWTSIERFVKSAPEVFDKRSMLLYVAHVDDVTGLKDYPPSKFVYAAIPLISMVDVLSLANVRAIAKLHGI